MFAILRNSNNQSLLATEASTKPPPYHRPPHIVCQTCRSKKLKCSGFRADGCLRCRASELKCVPVDRQPRKDVMRRKKSNKRIERTGHGRPQNLERATKNSSPVVDRYPQHSVSPSCDREVVTEASETHLGSCAVPLSLDATHSPMPGDPLSPLHIGRSFSGYTDATDDPAITTPSQGTISQLESQDTESSLEQAFEDIAAEPSTFQSCQCTEEALELLEQVCVQGSERWSTFGDSKSSTFEHLTTVRAVVRKLGLFATCFDCKDVPRLMTLLVLLSERLCAVFRTILEATFSKNVPGSVVPSQREISIFSDTLRRNRSPHYPDGNDDAAVTLCCGIYSLDVSEETSALFIVLSLAALQQLRKAIKTLWDRAQAGQSHGYLETLGSIKEQLHAVYIAMKARLTAE